MGKASDPGPASRGLGTQTVILDCIPCTRLLYLCWGWRENIDKRI